jgi:hypothetical protein
MRAAVDWESGVSSAWRNVVEFVPKLIVFVIILLIGWLVARLLQRVTNSVLERVGFDRAVERGGVGAALARGNYDASDIVAKLVYYAVWLIALELAFSVFGPNPVSNLLSQLVAWLPRLVVAIIIIVIASAIAKAVKDLITAALGALSYGRLIATIASVFILGLGVIAALNQVGIATAVTTPVLVAVLATIAGVIVVGVGGGLVRPMQHRWEGWLANAEAEAPRIRQQVQSGPSATQQVSQQYAEQYGQPNGSQYGQQSSGTTPYAEQYAEQYGEQYGQQTGSQTGQQTGTQYGQRPSGTTPYGEQYGEQYGQQSSGTPSGATAYGEQYGQRPSGTSYGEQYDEQYGQQPSGTPYDDQPGATAVNPRVDPRTEQYPPSV